MDKIIYRALGTLHTLDNNPRFIKDREFQLLCQSIANNPEHFEARPLILSNRTGKMVIIAGNMRYRAALHLGFKEVPTYLIKGLTEEKEREIIIRDNVNNGEWDWETLANSWSPMELSDWGVDIPPMPKVKEQTSNTSNVSAKLQHTCPSCGHSWIKAND